MAPRLQVLLLAAVLLAIAGCAHAHHQVAPITPSAPPDWARALLSGKYFVGEDQAVNTFEDEVIEKFSEERFDDLEAMAAAEAHHPHPLVAFQTAMDFFYAAFRRSDQISPSDRRPAMFEHFQAWERARPTSAVMPLAFANTCIAVAENDSTHEASMLSLADKCLAVAGQRAPHDPRVPALEMWIAFDRKDMAGADRAFHRAIAMDSHYLWAWLVYVEGLADAHGDWARVLDEAVAATHDRMGDATYALLVFAEEETITPDAVKSDRVPWSRLRQGFLDAGRLYPGSFSLLNTFAKYAWWKGDRTMARALFAKMGGDYDVPTWNGNDYEIFKDWMQRQEAGASDSDVPARMAFNPAPVPKPIWRNSPSQTLEKAHFESQVFQLLLRHQYHSLETIVAALRAPRPRLSSGSSSLGDFYDAFSDVGSKFGGGQIGTVTGYLRGWQSAYPKSSAPHIALAALDISYAWQARGEGYANTVTPQNWQLFGQRLEGAAKELDAAERLGSDRKGYTERLDLETGQGAGQLAARATFEKIRDMAPYYLPAYRTLANILLPRWYGAPGDVERFAETSSALTRRELGSSLYAVVALHVAPAEGESYFRDTRFTWSRIWEGFLDMKRHGLVRQQDAIDLFRLALLRNDRKAAGEALRALKASSSPWAGLGTVHGFEDWAADPKAPRPDKGVRAVVRHVGYFTRGLAANFPRDTTTSISASDPRLWGLEVRIIGFPAAPKSNFYRVRTVTQHPPYRLPGGTVETQSVNTYENLDTSSDPIYLCGWTFDRAHPWEWVPGRWTMRIEVDGHEVAHQTFTVKK